MSNAFVVGCIIIASGVYSAAMVYFWTNYSVVVRSQRYQDRRLPCEDSSED